MNKLSASAKKLLCRLGLNHYEAEGEGIRLTRSNYKAARELADFGYAAFINTSLGSVYVGLTRYGADKYDELFDNGD